MQAKKAPAKKPEPKFTHLVVYFPETDEYATIPKDAKNEKSKEGSKLQLTYPDRPEPYEAVVKAFCNSEPEGEMLTEKLQVHMWLGEITQSNFHFRPVKNLILNTPKSLHQLNQRMHAISKDHVMR